ncbi:MAG: hypothetical protein AABX02_01115, partial [archaeon]
VLWGTHQTFWVIVGGILFLAYLLNIGVRSAGKGVHRVGKKTRAAYASEIKEMENVTGKYPSKFFDSVGKDIATKVNEHQAPAWAKNTEQANNARWTIVKPFDKAVESVNKFLDGLGKLFSK